MCSSYSLGILRDELAASLDLAAIEFSLGATVPYPSYSVWARDYLSPVGSTVKGEGERVFSYFFPFSFASLYVDAIFSSFVTRIIYPSASFSSRSITTRDSLDRYVDISPAFGEAYLSVYTGILTTLASAVCALRITSGLGDDSDCSRWLSYSWISSFDQGCECEV